jgi:hypothetical protein
MVFQFGNFQYLLVYYKWSKTDDFKGITDKIILNVALHFVIKQQHIATEGK